MKYGNILLSYIFHHISQTFLRSESQRFQVCNDIRNRKYEAGKVTSHALKQSRIFIYLFISIMKLDVNLTFFILFFNQKLVVTENINTQEVFFSCIMPRRDCCQKEKISDFEEVRFFVLAVSRGTANEKHQDCVIVPHGFIYIW